MTFSVPCTFSGLTLTADKGGALRFRTRTELTDAEVTAMKNAFQSEGVLVFADSPLSPSELADAQDKRTAQDRKKPSQLLRDVLYQAWKKGVRVEPGEDSEHYYRRRVLTFKAIVLEEMAEAEG